MGDLSEHIKINILMWPKHIVQMFDEMEKEKDKNTSNEKFTNDITGKMLL